MRQSQLLPWFVLFLPKNEDFIMGSLQSICINLDGQGDLYIQAFINNPDNQGIKVEQMCIYNEQAFILYRLPL